MCLCPESATPFTVSIQQFIVSYSKVPDAFTCRFQRLLVDFKHARTCHLSDMCRTLLFQQMLSLYRDAKDGEIIGIIVENKHINGLGINLECVIITFNHGCSVF